MNNKSLKLAALLRVARTLMVFLNRYFDVRLIPLKVDTQPQFFNCSPIASNVQQFLSRFPQLGQSITIKGYWLSENATSSTQEFYQYG